MIIDCIADLHGHYPSLSGGDLLIIAGDLTARDDIEGWSAFDIWLQNQPYKHKIVVCGNHDMSAQVTPEIGETLEKSEGVKYLCDSGTEVEGFKIWGTPWTLFSERLNLRCRGFTGTEEELKEKFDLIPDDINILVSHGPAKGILDRTTSGEEIGSVGLLEVLTRVQPFLHVFGHVHEGYGYYKGTFKTEAGEELGVVHCLNSSYVNEKYEVINEPFRVNTASVQEECPPSESVSP